MPECETIANQDVAGRLGSARQRRLPKYRQIRQRSGLKNRPRGLVGGPPHQPAVLRFAGEMGHLVKGWQAEAPAPPLSESRASADMTEERGIRDSLCRNGP